MFPPPLSPIQSNAAQLKQTLSSKPGEMRFGPVVYDADLQGLIENAEATEDQIYVFAAVKASWDVDSAKVRKDERLTNEHVFRVATHCGFDERRIMKLLHNTQRRYFELSAFDLEQQFLTKTLFPCPGLKTQEGWDTIYMRPSRFFVKESRTRDIVDNLGYVMNPVKLRSPNGEIAFMANMEGWTMDNFSKSYCMKFLAALQGRTFPVDVSLFMIVNPPSWFEKVWKIMRTMLSAEFVQKIILISDEELPYLMDVDFQKYLPDEIIGGEANTNELVKDFVSFAKAQELIVKPSWYRKRGILDTLNGSLHGKRSNFWKSMWRGTSKGGGKMGDFSDAGTVMSTTTV